MELDEINLRRLSITKFLINNGEMNSTKIAPFSSMAILNFHDAIEILFDIILEEYGESAKDYGFMECFKLINEHLKEKDLSPSMLKNQLNKLKDNRVNIKHKGIFPSDLDVQSAMKTTIRLFEEFCDKFFSISYDEIDLIYLLNDSKTKEYLLNIKTTDQMEDIVKNLSISFEYLMKDFEETKSIPQRKSPYKVFKHPQLSAKNLSIKDKKLEQYIKITNENLLLLEEHVKILSLGFDFNKYAQFRLYVPNATWIPPGEFEVNLIGDENLTQTQIEFCKNFIIECALILYANDFEVPQDWGMK